uniref:R-spondin-3-like isoform X1 n=1 Tax=Ciona intestinalis TaxID=7719 RepID=UPI00089DCD54|nr:R-spondin-3-like isoform X1 [Ciona intestinalis]|eukprot:XP_026696630.1 R-spondin-3-like isoform X1 [Ciona intestinalis]
MECQHSFERLFSLLLLLNSLTLSFPRRRHSTQRYPRSRPTIVGSLYYNRFQALAPRQVRCDPTNCSECNLLNGCLKCRPKWFILIEKLGSREIGRCYETCPSGYYHKRSNVTISTCLKCPGNCTSCFGNFCLHCNAGYYRQSNGKCKKVKCRVKCHVRKNETRRCPGGGFYGRKRYLSKSKACRKRKRTCCGRKRRTICRRNRNGRKRKRGRKTIKRCNNDTKSHSNRQRENRPCVNCSFFSRKLTPTTISSASNRS